MTCILIYIYIYIIKKKQQTGHIRIINLFPSCYAFLKNQKTRTFLKNQKIGKFKCSLLNSFLS